MTVLCVCTYAYILMKEIIQIVIKKDIKVTLEDFYFLNISQKYEGYPSKLTKNKMSSACCEMRYFHWASLKCSRLNLLSPTQLSVDFPSHGYDRKLRQSAPTQGEKHSRITAGCNSTAAGSTEGGPLVISVETSPLFNCLITYLTDFSNHNGNNCASTQGADQSKEKLRTSKDHPSTITVHRLLQAVKYLGPFF